MDHDYRLNGQVTVGPATFWRVDDDALFEAPDYSPVTMLQQPPMLLNQRYFDVDQARELVKRMNGEA